MGRTLGLLVVALIVASCGGSYKTPPRNLDNACAIASEKPRYAKAFKATQKKWGLPIAVQMATIYQESRFRGDARTPFRYTLGVIPMGRQSSAFGYAQALDGTWEEYKQETGRRSAKRDRITDATDFMGWYMTKTRAKNGIPLTDARNQYLAYHEGHTGFARGSFRKKGWLMQVSSKVEERAQVYAIQLSNCRAFK